MRDAVTITTTTDFGVDNEVDPNTFASIPSAGQTPTAIYSGKALVVPDTARMFTSSGTEVSLSLYRVLLPSTAPLVPPGAVVTMDTAVDPVLTDKTLIVDSAEASSFNISRNLRARLVTAARPVSGG